MHLSPTSKLGYLSFKLLYHVWLGGAKRLCGSKRLLLISLRHSLSMCPSFWLHEVHVIENVLNSNS